MIKSPLPLLAALLVSLFLCCPSPGPTPTAGPPTAAPTPSPLPTATPSPKSTPPVTFMTIDGYDPASDSIVDPINVWQDYENRDAGIATQVHHGDKVKFIQRKGDGILIETLDGTQGWVTYWFVKELKEDYLATFTPSAATETPISTEPTLAPPLPTDTPAPAGQCPGGCLEQLPGCDIKGNISSSGEKIYHVPGQRDYNKTKISPEKGERWFCTEDEARAAGWRKAQR